MANNISRQPTLRDYCIILFRRKAIFLTFFFGLIISVTVLSFALKPFYRAETIILVEKAEEEPLTPLKVPISEFVDRLSLMSTQVRFIKTRRVLEKTVIDLSLAEKLPIKGEYKFEKAVLFLKRKLKIAPVRNTDFISIRLDLQDRLLGVQIVNAVTKNYVDFYFKIKATRSSSVLEFIDAQINVVNVSLGNAEAALRDYEENYDIVSLRDEARISLEKLFDEEKHLVYLLEEYKAGYPDINAARTEIQNIKEKLKDFPQKKMQLRRMEYTTENLKEIYLMLLKKREEMQIAVAMEKDKIGQVRNIEIIEPATVPIKPVWPKKRINILAAIFLGVFGGMGMVFWANYMDHRLYTREDIKKYLGYSIVGSIGSLPNVDTLFTKPEGVVFESYQELLNAIKVFSASPVKALLVTSSSRGEGKTVTALNLALTLSKNVDKKILLVDADTVHPCLHKLFETSHEPGLINFADKEDSVRNIILTTRLNNLFFIPSGVENSLNKPLDFERLKDFIINLKNKFDYIIFDSSSCGLNSATLAISSSFDYALFVIKAGSTRREVAKMALERLVPVGPKSLGIMLNCQRYEVPGFLYKRL
ncbi:MAG: AAA family ATPase [Candidatus Omnitrophica bacterium]|nr:AAA family ATPase [Candidatus Omnitrophota bacterium]